MREIETKRLVLRMFQKDDYQDLYEYLSDRNTIRYLPWESLSLDACKVEAYHRSGKKNFIAIVLKDTKKVIGNIALQKCSFDSWQLIIVLNSHYRHQGFGLEAMHAMLEECFLERKMRKLIALCVEQNNSACKLLERAGFLREGYLRENIYFNVDENNEPVWLNTYEYGLLSKEYMKKNSTKDRE